MKREFCQLGLPDPAITTRLDPGIYVAQPALYSLQIIPRATSSLIFCFVFYVSVTMLILNTHFYRAALNAGRSSREKGVRPSVCLFVHQTREL